MRSVRTVDMSMAVRPAEAYHLAPGEILNHKYIVGTAIDSGGFGIIYRAWDAQMEQVVAIKEYFPNGVVSRVPGKTMLLSIRERIGRFSVKVLTAFWWKPGIWQSFPSQISLPCMIILKK